MGSVWKPELALGNALYDTLPDAKKAVMNFEDLTTTRFADPIFNNTFHRVWIDHVLYSRNAPAGWVGNAEIPRQTPQRPFWRIADHYPVTVEVNTALLV